LTILFTEFHYETDDGKEFKGYINVQQSMTFPAFTTLLENYPALNEGKPAHPSVDNYANQCAIRLSGALQLSGVDMSSYTVNKTTDGYARSAQGLANWIGPNFTKPVTLPKLGLSFNYIIKDTDLLPLTGHS